MELLSAPRPCREHLHNASFFVLSLGRRTRALLRTLSRQRDVQPVDVFGPALIDGGPSMTIQDRGGDVFPLSAPVRG